MDAAETFYRSAPQYNLTIHSVTDKKPFEVFYNKTPHDDLPDKLRQAQAKRLERNKPTQIKHFQPDQEIYEKLIGKRDKLDLRYKKQKIKEDLGYKVKE